MPDPFLSCNMNMSEIGSLLSLKVRKPLYLTTILCDKAYKKNKKITDVCFVEFSFALLFHYVLFFYFVHFQEKHHTLFIKNSFA